MVWYGMIWYILPPCSPCLSSSKHRAVCMGDSCLDLACSMPAEQAGCHRYSQYFAVGSHIFCLWGSFGYQVSYPIPILYNIGNVVTRAQVGCHQCRHATRRASCQSTKPLPTDISSHLDFGRASYVVYGAKYIDPVSLQLLNASGTHLDLIRAPYVLYGVKYIGLVSLCAFANRYFARLKARFLCYGVVSVIR